MTAVSLIYRVIIRVLAIHNSWLCCRYIDDSHSIGRLLLANGLRGAIILLWRGTVILLWRGRSLGVALVRCPRRVVLRSGGRLSILRSRGSIVLRPWGLVVLRPWRLVVLRPRRLLLWPQRRWSSLIAVCTLIARSTRRWRWGVSDRHSTTVASGIRHWGAGLRRRWAGILLSMGIRTWHCVRWWTILCRASILRGSIGIVTRIRHRRSSWSITLRGGVCIRRWLAIRRDKFTRFQRWLLVFGRGRRVEGGRGSEFILEFDLSFFSVRCRGILFLVCTSSRCFDSAYPCPGEMRCKHRWCNEQFTPD